MVKFLIIGDLHGQKPKIHYKDFDAIIAPGDFCSDSSKSIMFEEVKIRLKNPNSKIRWYDITGRKEARKIVNQSISDGREILEYLNSQGVPVFIVPGNWDWTSERDAEWAFLNQDHYQKLIDGLGNIISIHNKDVNFQNYSFIGYGTSCGPEFPQYESDLARFNKRELAKKKRDYLAELKKLEKLFRESTSPVLFLSHNVPFNTTLDQIVNPNSPRNGQHFGSLISRQLIDKYQPLVCIGGHMHEHFGKDKIGKTTVINAGFGSNVNTYLELEGNKIVKLEFYKGK